MNAKGIKADDVEGEVSTTSFTVVEPTSVMFDFSKMDVIRVYADDYISITVTEGKILSQITIVKGVNNFNLSANEGNLTSASLYIWIPSVAGADENGLTTVVFTSERGRSDIQSVNVEFNTTTGIAGIEAEEGEAVYNLQGVRVKNSVKGLYIHVANGKSAKVIM